LKPARSSMRRRTSAGSIHPQGWVPIETRFFSRKLKTTRTVAFTPKGGCPLKHLSKKFTQSHTVSCSIHPQGWVPIETRS